MHILSWRRWLGCFAGLVLCSLPGRLNAGGFFIPEQTTAGLGRAFAGDAAGIDDPSTIFSNPAGMTQLRGAEASSGISVLIPSVTVENTGSTATTPGTLGTPVHYSGGDGGNTSNLHAIPNLYAAFPAFDKKLWFGLGVTSPFGLSLSYDPGWFGRYDSIDQKLLTIDVAPSVAYRINDFISIGGGLDVQYADASRSNALPNTLLPGGPTAATDGLLSLEGHSFAVGYNLGVVFEPLPSTRIGIAYRSGMSQNLDGQATVSGLSGPLAGQNGSFDASTEVNLPAIVSLAVRQQISPKLSVLAEGQWFDWSSFDEVRVKFADGRPDIVLPEHYRDSYTASIGAEYQWNEDLTIRGGFRFDETPTVDAFRNTGLPDGNHYWITLGATYRLSDHAVVDAAYAHIFYDSSAVDLTHSFYGGTPAAGSTTVEGLAHTGIDVVSLNFRYRF